VQTEGDRIDLARAPRTRIGRLMLDPPVRQVRRDDGAQEVIEPRVMQVLLALAQAQGGIVTRDMLTERCWEGRVVGEDAINRVISRLRRLSEGLGAGSFRLETVTRIGYRLIVDGASAPVPVTVPDAAADGPAAPRHFGRRALIAGAAAAALAGGGGWFLWHHGKAGPALSPEIADMMNQANLALRQGTAEGSSTAIGLFRRVVELQPDYAQGWAALAQAYALTVHGVAPDLVPTYEARGRQAAARAQALDPGNLDAELALALILPFIGHWREVEQACRKVLAERPDDYRAQFQLAHNDAQVGRCREQAAILDRLAVQSGPVPVMLYQHCQALWSAGRLDDADRATEEAFRIAPRQFQVWFTRFYLLLYTARPEQAIAMAQDLDNRPTGIAAAQFDDIIAVARAMQSRDRAAIDAVEHDIVEAAHHGGGYAENSMQFASALGRLDTAFRIADAYFLDRGFSVGTLRFTQEQGVYSRLAERRAHILFLPSTAAMRADPRFERLVREIGLERYWRESGSKPDYRV
jgi:DNA-binding winged helix-turn-helix (wHTH) protein/tetratricopeptide (TPR) repeat protein